MARLDKLRKKAERNPDNLNWSDFCSLCEGYFGPPRDQSGSHITYRVPWAPDLLVNIQRGGKTAKGYQVRQVLKYIREMRDT